MRVYPVTGSSHADRLLDTARALVASGRGILAADESVGTMNARLADIGLEGTAEHRRRYRELLFRTPDLSRYISGVICFDETLRQSADDGTPLPAVLEQGNLIAGIKVDTGAKPLPGSDGETITEGLDGLAGRLAEYAQLGARFAKWRAVIHIDGAKPTSRAIAANAQALGRYASLCQAAGLVPIVEPEVLMTGDHPIERCEQVTTAVLHRVFAELVTHDVLLEGIVLKPNMVVPGQDAPEQASVAQVADATLRCLYRTVPAAVPGVAFLSGGQSDRAATEHLQELNLRSDHPWQLTFSYGRALISAALRTWAGDPDRVEAAQRTLYTRARANAAASGGRYTPRLEAVPA